MLKDRINPNLAKMEDDDLLYHFFLHSGMDLQSVFGDVQFVCMGGSPVRAEHFANRTMGGLLREIIEAEALENSRKMAKDFAYKVAEEMGFEVADIYLPPIGKTERYSLFKVGPIISVSHGIDMPSMSITLHEITKLLYYAGVQNPTYFRIGTSGGVGVEGGTVVIASQALDGMLRPEYRQIVLGKERVWPTNLDPFLAQDIMETSGDISVVYGNTMGTDDFYEEQGRLDGSLNPGYTEEDKMAFLREAYEAGLRNIEMEATYFAHFCLRMRIHGAIVNVALLNRLNGDQVTATPEELKQYSANAENVVTQYMKAKLQGKI